MGGVKNKLRAEVLRFDGWPFFQDIAEIDGIPDPSAPGDAMTTKNTFPKSTQFGHCFLRLQVDEVGFLFYPIDFQYLKGKFKHHQLDGLIQAASLELWMHPGPAYFKSFVGKGDVPKTS